MGFGISSTWLVCRSLLQAILKPLKPLFNRQMLFLIRLRKVVDFFLFHAFFMITPSCLHPFLPSLRPSGSPARGFGTKGDGDEHKSQRKRSNLKFQNKQVQQLGSGCFSSSNHSTSGCFYWSNSTCFMKN